MPHSPSFFADLPLAALEDFPDRMPYAFDDSWDDRRLIAEIGIESAIIVYRKTNDSYVIVDGHRRRRAANALGLESVPCRVHPNLTPGESARIRFDLQDINRLLTQAELTAWWKRTRDTLPAPQRHRIKRDMLAMRLA